MTSSPQEPKLDKFRPESRWRLELDSNHVQNFKPLTCMKLYCILPLSANPSVKQNYFINFSHGLTVKNPIV